MIYLEWFIVVNFCWGVATLTLIPLSERKRFNYTKFANILLVLSWFYLGACVPIFKDGFLMPDYLSNFYVRFAIILSIEVWIVMLLTLLAIGLAKKSHDSEHKSYMLLFHKPLRRFIKPLWIFISVLNGLNAGYYFVNI